MSLVGDAEGSRRKPVFRSFENVVYRVRGIVELNDAQQFGEGYLPIDRTVVSVMGIAGGVSPREYLSPEPESQW